MIKVIFLIVSLSLIACTSQPDLRSDVYIKADGLLKNGMNAYHNDHYRAGIQFFNRAIEWYQSVADEQGIQKARLNIANTALAYSDFVMADTHIKILNKQSIDGLLDKNLQHRLIFLQTKFYFLQQDYPQALTTIKPLLTQSPPSLKLLATMARLEALNSKATQTQWLSRFQNALKISESKHPKSHIILKRILAYSALQKTDYTQAEDLLTQALKYYQQQAHRRNIADCLERLAELELIRKKPQKAVERWNQALKIYVWLKDETKAKKIRKQLAKF